MRKYLLFVMVMVCCQGIALWARGAQDSDSDEFAWIIETGGFVDVNPLEVKGNIVVAGSSTVFPLAEALAQRFQDEGYDDTITIDSIGSGAGFERFCSAGEIDIANASRPINDSEVENCRAIGREPIEIRIGTDALTVVVNPQNDWVSNVTVEALATMFTAERWNDVDPSWPDRTIERFVPGTDSGTFDYFIEAVFDDDAEPLLSARNVQFSEDDNVLVLGVLNSIDAIGFFGYAYYTENASRLALLTIEEIAANVENMNAGRYPLARPLFMYSDATIMREKPHVAAFLAFVLNYVNDEIDTVGYFAAEAAALEEAKDKWMATFSDRF